MSTLIAPPSQLFRPLYPGLGANAKIFADSIPKDAPQHILDRFAAEAPANTAALQAFIDRWFTPPEEPSADAIQSRLTLSAHIEALWSTLTRESKEAPAFSSLLALPKRYLVPGGMFRECYYWDTYFTLIGLGENNRALAQDSVDNLAYLIDRFGFVPNANRTYYLTRSHPPVFYAAVASLAPEAPERAFARYLPQLRREHAYWITGEDELAPGEADRCVVKLDDGAVLNRYWDELDSPRDEAFDRDIRLATRHAQRPHSVIFREIRAGCATGWDFSSRWLADRSSLGAIDTTSILPIDLNCLIYGLERAIGAGARESGDNALAAEFERRARERALAINDFLWNDELGLFDDYDWRAGKQRDAVTPAALFALFAGIANPTQARRTADIVRRRLLKTGGIVTSLHESGQQWDAPNGWAPLQWIAVEGLNRYGHTALAAEVAQRWVAMVTRVFQETGRLVEKYNVITASPGGGGEYPLQDGFGWTNGVTAALLQLYPELHAYGSVRPKS